MFRMFPKIIVFACEIAFGYTRERKILRHHSAVYQTVRRGGGGFFHN